MRELAREVLAGQEAWVVGGAVRDELLGRPVVDLDVACRSPERAARAYADRAHAGVFPLSERHGAWRVALPDGLTVDFTPLREGILADLASRDFAMNAIAEPLAGGERVDPYEGSRDLAQRTVRALGAHVFADDPLRLLRAVRFEDELGFHVDPATEAAIRANADLVTRPAGERIVGELARLSARGFRRLHELGLLEPLGGGLERLDGLGTEPKRDVLLVAVFGEALERYPIPTRLRRYAAALLRARRPADASAREIHRFRRATEPWALDALDFVGAAELAAAVCAARASEPAAPLLRGDELGMPQGPEIGRLLERVAEERAAGTVATREDALELVRREARW
jgi:tRNA nucleotidyltransferase/poly(A) polymerase